MPSYIIKQLIKVLLLLSILVVTLSSCSNSNPLPSRVLYDNETELTFSEQTVSYIKSLTPPDGITVFFLTERYIDSTNIAKRADNWFDHISKRCDGFEENGVAVIISLEPKLIQVRVGSNYSYYLKMKGITSGHDYIKMQKSISRNKLIQRDGFTTGSSRKWDFLVENQLSARKFVNFVGVYPNPLFRLLSTPARPCKWTGAKQKYTWKVKRSP